MEKVFFHKYSGAGNDFVIIDKNENPGFAPSKESIIKICDRHFGVGADGLIVFSNHPAEDFEMNYYNSDGSAGSLCGNGARCAIQFAKLNGKFTAEKVSFISNGKIFEGEILKDDLVKFFMEAPAKIKYNFKIKIDNNLINSSFVHTGSPHVVIKVEDLNEAYSKPLQIKLNLKDVDVINLGRAIRYHSDFAPEGTNVNFIQILESKVYIRTYERGVENETLACGTGSAAAAFIAYVSDNLKPPIIIKTSGGDELIVDFQVEKSRVKNLSLIGPAVNTFNGYFYTNSLLK
jgi:diaminopimelate epimerase